MPALAQLWRGFYKCGTVSGALQPVGKRGPSNTGSNNQDTHIAALRWDVATSLTVVVVKWQPRNRAKVIRDGSVSFYPTTAAALYCCRGSRDGHGCRPAVATPPGGDVASAE